MKKLFENKKYAALALVLAVALGVGLFATSFAADREESGEAESSSGGTAKQASESGGSAVTGRSMDIPYSYDEALYATLDYYGGIIRSSVVKSYDMNGNTVLVDYGDYSEINNLTDDAEGSIADGRVYFSWDEEDAPEHFYFEGVTDEPLLNFPWTMELSYKMNGVKKAAEELAGEKGVAEIILDVLPNEKASEYMKNNMVLSAVSTFSGDDVLSLEAPGGQVQLMGNQRVVLFIVMPGEEQHFTIRVGTDDFSYNGMIFTAFPATLDQLSQIAELRDAKEEAEDSYDAIQDSMDVVLDTLEGMSGSLNDTADGLDKLDMARQNIYDGREDVYAASENLQTGLDAMAEELKPISGHLNTASRAIRETKTSLREVADQSAKLREEVETLQDRLWEFQMDSRVLKRRSNELASDLTTLQRRLNTLEGAIGGLNSVSKIEEVEDMKFDVDGQSMKLSEIQTELSQLDALHTAYEGYLAANGLTEELLSFEAFTQNYLTQQAVAQYMAAGLTAEQAQAQVAANDAAKIRSTAAKYNKLYERYLGSDEKKAANLKTLQTISDAGAYTMLIDQTNGEIDDINNKISGIKTPTTRVLASLEEVCSSLSDLLNELGVFLRDADEGIDETDDFIGEVKALMAKAEDLVTLLEKYEPDMQEALKDMDSLSDTAMDTIGKTNDFISAVDKFMKDNDEQLNEATAETLSGLSEALRRSTAGLDQTETIRNAKDVIDELIRDKWDENTGDKTRLLLMDAAAVPTSLTSSENIAPSSIQFILRSQEIKTPDEEKASVSAQTAEKVGIIGKIKEMLTGIVAMISGLFG